MKQYDRFGEYMFDLLFAPLKKGKRTANQLYIFFKVIGRIFDGLKEDALRVRDETNVATASPIMLPVHGQDRNMPRLAGESVEAYRTRLAMKGIISEWGGTRQGILYILAALGYEEARVEPMGPKNPEQWAEFIVETGVGRSNAVKDAGLIYNEIQAVKEGSSRMAGLIITLPTSFGALPLTPSLGPRQGETAPPPFQPPPAAAAKMYVTPLLGVNFSTVTLPMAAGRKGG